ncbi:MAG: transglutaminase-like domain-containing protein [Arenimonas sp.]
MARPLDVVERLVVASPVRIPGRLARAKLRYVLSRADGQPPVVAETGEQAVVRDGSRAIVTICADCGSTRVETDASLAPYLKANAWVRSDHPKVRAIAARAGGNKASVHDRMQALASQVRRRLGKGAEFLGYADAVQALRTGRGDCTEYAVLLAALARAQGLPTRVVVGMVYASRFTGRKDSFSPHAWVQVYENDRWVSYDAAFDGFDSTHVALATGTGDPTEVFAAFTQLRQLRIERVGEVR